MPTELEELVSFLHSPQPAVVQIALDNLVGYSTGPSQQIFSYDNYEAIKDLKKLSSSNSRTLVTQSVTILANLCEDTTMRNLIVEDLDYLKDLSTRIVRLKNSNADLMCILLNNLAKNDLINKILDFEFEPSEEEKQVFSSTKIIDCLMDCFVKGHDRKLNPYANYDYLAYFFADLSRFQQGRSYFVTEQTFDQVVPISKLLVFTEKYDDKIRREGVASTIKNSLFDTNAHMKLLTDPKINILPFILLPLAGPEDIDEDEMFDLPEELQLLPSDKQREPLSGIQCIHLESLLLLCTTKPAREYLREKQVYSIIRELHKATDVEEVIELCDRIVQMLKRDEAPDNAEIEAIESDEDDDKIVEIV
ncbi:HGH1 [Candida oxycetoniae]|uniref:Protein HGH1 homolog n=1 Tax=Candida oxycetoniae TaxID=497107 RepID=A0AAI9STT6_9ASCO|nr:HGH1 [Candida oxycetoniae]KAI3402726.1 HGH1 [Candida oxycetoniae]